MLEMQTQEAFNILVIMFRMLVLAYLVEAAKAIHLLIICDSSLVLILSYLVQPKSAV